MKNNKRKPKRYWTLELCQEDAINYSSRTEWSKSPAYKAAQKNGWIDDCCNHMIYKINPDWTFEMCFKICLKYKSKSELRLKNESIYRSIIKNKWSKKCFEHMIKKKKPDGYWTKEKCINEALKYKKKLDFKKNGLGAYDAAYKKKWMSDCCMHMEVFGNLYKRLIYIAVFTDNHIYIGLTGNPNRRFYEHISDERCVIYKHIKKTGLTPEFIKLTDFLENEQASLKEILFKEKYEKEGYSILNIAKPGSLGSAPRKWTKKICIIESTKYTSRSAFRDANNSAYRAIIKNGWQKECFDHMIYKRKF